MKKVPVVLTATVLSGFLIGGTALALQTRDPVAGRPLPADSALLVTTAVTEPGGETAFGVNQSGQTFGSGLDATDESGYPDLIAAVARDGTEGYIYATDAYPVYGSPEEAVAAAEERSQQDWIPIPLYLSDGKTVIGEFLLYSGP